jgi:hypothetical protein
MSKLPPAAGERVNVEDLMVGNQYYVINIFNRKIYHMRIISKNPIFVEGYPQGIKTFRIVIESTDPKKPYPQPYLTITNTEYEPLNFYEDTEYINLMDSIKKQPAKNVKDIAMGELKAMPGAIDYEATKEKFGKGLKTRKRRHRRKRTIRR